MKRGVGRRAAKQGGERHDQRTGTRPAFAQERLAEKRRTRSARTQASVSKPPPGDCGTMILLVRSGKICASAGASNAHAISKNAPIAGLLGARRFRAAAETSMTAP